MSSIFPATSLIIPGSVDVLCRGCRGRWGCSLTWVSVLPAVLLSRWFWLRHSHPRRQDKISDGVGGNTSCCWLSQRRYSAVNVKSLKDPLVVVIWPQADYLNNLLSFALVTSHEEWDLREERSHHPLDHPISQDLRNAIFDGSAILGFGGGSAASGTCRGTCRFWRSSCIIPSNTSVRRIKSSWRSGGSLSHGRSLSRRFPGQALDCILARKWWRSFV